MRHAFMRTASLSALILLSAADASAADSAAQKGVAALTAEMPIADLETEMSAGSLSSEELTRGALALIATRNARLHAVIAVNPDALDEARASDKARKTAAAGPLAGIPILIKDNIETRDRMATTAGSLALKDNLTYRDAPVVARLRAAGAVILGKTNLSEWANIRSSSSVSGWSAVGGLTANPYQLDRTACGSSSGSGAAIAADLAVIAVGTETDGSVTCPSSMNGLVGLKPTVGLVSRSLVVPISHSQDTPGPMGHSVRDVALLLNAMAGSDPADPATAEADAHRADYAAALTPDSLRGVRIGVLRDQLGSQPKTRLLFDAALATLAEAGAVIVDIADSKVDGLDDAEHAVLSFELKADLDAYLAATPATVRTRSLKDLIAFDREHAAEEMAWFGQDLFEEAEQTAGLADPAYLAATEKARGAARRIDALLADNGVTLLAAPTTGPAWLSDPVNGDPDTGGPSAGQLAATAGFPHLTVPMGAIQGLPVGLSLIGPKWGEGALLRAGYAFEQARGPLARPNVTGPVAASR